MNITPPALPAANPRKLKTEVGGFLLFLGVILTALGYFLYENLKGNPHNLFGATRNIAIGIPILFIGILHLLAGTLLFITSNKIWAIVGAFASALMALYYFIIAIGATGTIPINIISVLIVVIPVGVWIRVRVFILAQKKK